MVVMAGGWRGQFCRKLFLSERISGDNQSGTNVIWGQPGVIQRHYLIIFIPERSTNRAEWKPEGSQMASA